MTTKLQIPIDPDVREGLERRARSLGFDSAQAYIRVWAKAEAEGRKLDFDGDLVVLSPVANKRYERMIAESEAERDELKRLGEEVKSFSTVADMMKELRG